MNRNQRRIIMCFMALMCIACLAIGKIVSSSFKDNTDLYSYLEKVDPVVCYCDIGYDADTNVGFLDDEKMKDISDLQKDSDVVKAHIVSNKNRSIYYECVLSEVEVDSVYNGDIKNGSHIYIFEPVDCRQTQLDCTNGYSLMQENEEYVLFLTKLKNAGFGKGKYVYAPKSMTFGKYPCNTSVPKLFNEETLEEPGKMLPYSTCKSEIYLYNKNTYDKYCKFKEQITELLAK